jgi:ABC-2 type transport system permease protein
MKHLLRVHLLETKYECLQLIRMPAYSIPTILFPAVFYLFFGVVMPSARPATAVQVATYLVATYSAFGVMGASLFSFGVSIAVERGQGWTEVKRTTPMPASAYFIAKLLRAMLFSAVVVLLLFTLGIYLGGVSMTVLMALRLLFVLLAGSITFSALGLAIGYFAGPNSAAAIVNLIFLPLSFLSGLWIPIFMLPKTLQKVAVFLPPFHFSQIALGIIGAGRGGAMLPHVVAMGIATLLFLTVAVIGYRRDEGKLYG